MNRWLARHIFWPLTEYTLGRDTLRRFRQLQSSEQLDPETRQELINHKLRRLIAHAAAVSPFYARRFRDARLDPADPRLSPADLTLLPALSRAEIRDHLDEMTWFACPGGVRPYHTGGSSGQPLRFYVDNFRNAADAAARLRSRAWWNVQPGDPEILLWGAPTELRANDRFRRGRDRLLNQRILNAFDMTAEHMDRYIHIIRRGRPACLYGYASSLALLARHALHAGQPAGSLGHPDLKAIFVTGEVLLDHDRRDIEAAFAAPVAIEYGSRDGGLAAMSCPAGTLHVNDENIILELLDAQGRPVEPGDLGEVTITHLEAFGTPLIRYAVGDMARRPAAGEPQASARAQSDPRPPRCPCGRTLSLLREVQGRVTDQILCLRDGRLQHMHALALLYVIRETEGVAQFRVTQEALDSIEVAVVPDRRYSPASRTRIESGLRARLGPGMTIRVREQSHIPPTAAGKHACVVSRLDRTRHSLDRTCPSLDPAPACAAHATP